MKIQSVQTRLYHVPLPTVLSDSTHGFVSHFVIVTVTIRADDGTEGVGYTYTVGKIGGRAVASLVQDDLMPVLLDADPRHIEQLWEKMWWHLHYVGRGGIASFAISAVDVALWDLKAKVAREPLWRLLGGHSNRVRVYAGGVDLQLSLDELRGQTESNLERGFRAIKMKVGRDRMDEDIARVAAIRDLIGADIPLMVDANMRWNVEEAVRASRAMAPHDVYWLEEPTIPDDVAGHARIATQGPLPIATGENFRTIYEFQQMIRAGGVAFPEPDVSNIGGITAWMKVAHLAESFNLPVTSHGVHDLHVHLLAAVPNDSYMEVHGFGLDAYIRHPLEFVDGYATAADRPGHGIEFDWSLLEPHRVEKQ